MSDKPLPCPCCGAEPVLEKLNNGESIVFCEDHPFAQATGKTKNQAIKRWNESGWKDALSENTCEENDDDKE